MVKGSSFHDFVMSELFADIEGIRSRSMFGGRGIYKQSLRTLGLKDDIFFALISNGQLFFKVGHKNKSDYEKYDSKPFVYTGHREKIFSCLITSYLLISWMIVTN